MLRSHETAKAVNVTQINFEGEVIANVTLLGKTNKLKMYVRKKHRKPIRFRLNARIQFMGLGYIYVLQKSRIVFTGNRKFNL